MSAWYPVFLDLRGRRCVVAGGGAVAARKAAGLLAAGAEVTVVAPVMCGEIAGCGARLERRECVAEDFRGAGLVFVAVDDPAASRRLAGEARAQGAWVNVADTPEACDFVLPAVLNLGEAQVAVCTGGAAPSLAAELRDDIGKVFGPEVAEHTAFVARARIRVKEAVADPERRRRILRRLSSAQTRKGLAENGAAWGDDLLARLLGME